MYYNKRSVSKWEKKHKRNETANHSAAEALSLQPHNQMTWMEITKQLKAVRSCEVQCSHEVKRSSLIQNFSLKSKVAAKKKSAKAQEETASMLSHTMHIGALIKDVSSLASFEVGARTSCPAIYWLIFGRQLSLESVLFGLLIFGLLKILQLLNAQSIHKLLIEMLFIQTDCFVFFISEASSRCSRVSLYLF